MHEKYYMQESPYIIRIRGIKYSDGRVKIISLPRSLPKSGMGELPNQERLDCSMKLDYYLIY
jgi:hypothetical protein